MPSIENVLQDGSPEPCSHGQPRLPADIYLPGNSIRQLNWGERGVLSPSAWTLGPSGPWGSAVTVPVELGVCSDCLGRGWPVGSPRVSLALPIFLLSTPKHSQAPGLQHPHPPLRLFGEEPVPEAPLHPGARSVSGRQERLVLLSISCLGPVGRPSPTGISHSSFVRGYSRPCLGAPVAGPLPRELQTESCTPGPDAGPQPSTTCLGGR